MITYRPRPGKWVALYLTSSFYFCRVTWVHGCLTMWDNFLSYVKLNFIMTACGVCIVFLCINPSDSVLNIMKSDRVENVRCVSGKHNYLKVVIGNVCPWVLTEITVSWIYLFYLPSICTFKGRTQEKFAAFFSCLDLDTYTSL